MDPGFGQGYAPHEFAGYGIPVSERLSRFVEGLDVLQGLWSQDTFSYSGRHYQIDNARLVPKPVQDPMPIWLGATTPPGVRRAGRRGANLLMVGGRALQEEYAQARQEGGFAMQDAKVLNLQWGHIAGSVDEAWDEAGPHFHHLMTVYQEFANASGGEGGPRPGQVPPVAELRDPKARLMFRPAIGDAASAYDPITSQGICKALANGWLAAEVICAQSDLDRYAQTVQTAYRHYVALRRYCYGLEQRWPRAPFWKKFHASPDRVS